MNKPTISYAIPVWNEHEEISRLLAQLFDIRWAPELEAHGIFPPAENSRIGDAPKEEAKDREAAGAKL